MKAFLGGCSEAGGVVYQDSAKALDGSAGSHRVSGPMVVQVLH